MIGTVTGQRGKETSPPDLVNTTDEKLIELFISSKDERAFEEIVNRYADKIYRLAFKITRDYYSAEEILQEVFLTLINKIDTFRGESKFSSWLYRVTANAAYMHLRAQKKYENDVSLEDYVPYDENGTLMGRIKAKDWSDKPDKALLSEEAMEIIEKAVNELPEPYRVVFHLRDVEGFSNQEVSEVLGLSVPALKSRLHRARLYLRDKLSDYFYEWSK
ncbi:MAG: ECF subfamily RNA polymerase sigma-24 factor, RNA polymerase sigma-70 factor, ECF subfamily [Candidatus Dadabacteria bacterium CSP1-2]|jgi:RNA polymerase sigma-70 factor (ECF subfamily)|nr:MAG: ECF subfamily RNA polymerase sigma-24 factor, RNA polymerase sigma-70 factor, ECF subfamily [Candidatus Dadabacteria bacterium CSP1-2]